METIGVWNLANSEVLADRTAFLVEEACRRGADAADAIALEENSVGVSVLNGKLEHAERSEGTEVGLRVLVGPRQACVSSSDVRQRILVEMVEKALAMARESEPDPYAGLASQDQLATDVDVQSLEFFDAEKAPTPEEMEEAALRTEAAALRVEGVSKVESASFGIGDASVHLHASNGFSAGYRQNYRVASCTAISGSGLGMEIDYYGESRIFASDMSSPEEIGRIAGERAAERAGARKPRTGAYPVLFDRRVSASLIGHLMSAINGGAIARGSSWLLNSLGEQVLPSELSVFEDPRRLRSGASRPFDSEGLATQAQTIVASGELKTWILDLATGRRLDMASTGNAYRGTSSPPHPGVSNIALTVGEKNRAELIEDMGEGLIVTSMLGATINPTTGDYSRGASGFWVEKGGIKYPVNELTIAGNLKHFLKSLIPANDPLPFKPYCVPSLLVEGLTIAGD